MNISIKTTEVALTDIINQARISSFGSTFALGYIKIQAIFCCDPTGNRTPVPTLKEWCPNR